jgi:hypothetical protein
MGQDYAYLSLKKRPEGLFVSQTVCQNAESHTPGKESAALRVNGDTFYLRVKVSEGAVCVFSYSADGRSFTPVGETFKARQGKWIGAKVGLFAVGTGKAREYGYADFDWFRVE